MLCVCVCVNLILYLRHSKHSKLCFVVVLLLFFFLYSDRSVSNFLFREIRKLNMGVNCLLCTYLTMKIFFLLLWVGFLFTIFFFLTKRKQKWLQWTSSLRTAIQIRVRKSFNQFDPSSQLVPWRVVCFVVKSFSYYYYALLLWLMFLHECVCGFCFFFLFLSIVLFRLFSIQ